MDVSNNISTAFVPEPFWTFFTDIFSSCRNVNVRHRSDLEELFVTSCILDKFLSIILFVSKVRETAY